MANPKQIKLIHTLKGALGLSDDDYRAVLAGYGVITSKAMSDRQAAGLVADLEAKALAAGVWQKKGARKKVGKRPHNAERKRGQKLDQASRARQLEKIEALLTVGGKPWGYADSLAQRICKVDRVAWVATGDLYKIITALRKQAQREGWDLSGEES
jgi:phage gp16-like protein